jgi:hypothetical protein
MGAEISVTRPKAIRRYAGKDANGQSKYVDDLETVTVKVAVADVTQVPQAYVAACDAIEKGTKLQIEQRSGSGSGRGKGKEDIPPF